MLARKVAVLMVAVAGGLTALGVGLAGGQDPRGRGPVAPLSEPQFDPRAQPLRGLADADANGVRPAGREYKFVATDGDRRSFEKAITEQGAAGWEFKGSERVRDEASGLPVLVLVFGKSAGGPAPLSRPAADPGRKTATVFKVNHGNAAKMAAVLTDTYQKSDIVIAAEPTSNSLLVSAPAATLADIARTIAALDRPPAAPGPGVDILPPTMVSFQLKRASAQAASEVLVRIYRDRTGVRVSFDVATNTLLVYAPEGTVAEIRALCQLLDAEQPRGR